MRKCVLFKNIYTVIWDQVLVFTRVGLCKKLNKDRVLSRKIDQVGGVPPPPPIRIDSYK